MRHRSKHHTWSICILSLLFVILASPAWAQAPDAPHKFWTKGNTALIVADGIAKGDDGFFTHRVLDGKAFYRCYVDASGVTQCPIIWIERGTELNALARPFFGTTGGQIAYFAGSWARDIGVAYLLHHTGHHKLEKVALSVGIGISVQGAAYSAHSLYTF